MKKKILFLMLNMNIGGTEKALLNMISQMPENDFDITILMLEKYGGFLKSIPSRVQIEYVDQYKELKGALNLPPRINAAKWIKEGHVFKGGIYLFIYYFSRLIRNKSLFFKYIFKDIPVYKKEYDIAVAYAGPNDFISYLVAHKIKSKSKIQWIHFDITKVGFDKNFAAKVYKKFEKIFVVSDEGRKKLVNAIPKLKEKIEVFLNLISPDDILDQSKSGVGFTDNFNGKRILTIGRLSSEKGQDLAIRVLGRLIKEGYNVKWYCIGEGSLRKEYEELIGEYNLKDNFILLGSNSNPYPFIVECDVYVQPSRYEGYCISILEAKFLEKPIVATNFNGIKEQIIDGISGLIVSIDEIEIYNAVKKLLVDGKMANQFSENLSKEKNNIKNRIEYI